jgi:type III secretion system YscQ/HrcQ family protein
VSTDPLEETPRDHSPARQPHLVDAGPLGWLPRLSRRQARLDERWARLSTAAAGHSAFHWLDEALGTRTGAQRPELLWRASGLLRPGLVAQFHWPSRRTRLALGIETTLAHAIVDRLLGFERTDAEARRQLTPVEWGVLTFVVARTLDELARDPFVPGADDLVLDRAGPGPFVPGDLGTVVTLRWSARIGTVAGAVRLWVPEARLAQWLDEAPACQQSANVSSPRFRELASLWRASAGTIAMPRGLGRLRVGGVLPIDATRLRGTSQSPQGVLALELVRDGRAGGPWFPAEVVPLSGGGRLAVTSTLQQDPIPREALPVTVSPNPASEPAPTPGDGGQVQAPAAADIPVTLTVELGRVSLTLGRLADLRPGDVIELARHSRAPVELTSNGRLVARGELVQIDTELGVRVTHVFL